MGKNNYKIDLDELRIFVLKHPDYSNDKIAFTFGVGRTRMYQLLDQLGFIRRHTPKGLRYEIVEEFVKGEKCPCSEKKVESEVPAKCVSDTPAKTVETCKKTEAPCGDPVKKNPWMPPFSVIHDADDKISTNQIKKNTEMDLRLLGREINIKIDQVRATGKMKGSSYKEITIAIPQELYYQFQCVRFNEAEKMAKNTPLSNWTRGECMRMSVEGMWFLQLLIDGVNEKIKDWTDDGSAVMIAVHTGIDEFRPCDTKSDKDKNTVQS